MATVEVALLADGTRVRRSRESERSDKREDNVRCGQDAGSTVVEGSSSQPQDQIYRVGEGWSRPENAEAATYRESERERAATAVEEMGPPGWEVRGVRVQRSTAGSQRAPGVEEKGEAPGDSGGRAAYAVGPPHALGGGAVGGGGSAANTVGLQH